ncbi:MAG: hypothetical protein ACYC6F_02800 [Longimicrobiales bacterium]
MRISHRQLEAAIKNPTEWKRQQAAAPGFFQLGYDEAVRLAILKFHKLNSESAAAAHLESTLRRHSDKLKSKARRGGARDDLASYIAWAKQHDLDVVDARVNLSFPTPSGIELSGRITRVDVLSSGYRGVLLGSFSDDWSKELRFPLLQAAIANHYSVPVDDTQVGVQGVDGSGLQCRSYDLSERAAAFERLSALATQLGV